LLHFNHRTGRLLPQMGLTSCPSTAEYGRAGQVPQYCGNRVRLFLCRRRVQEQPSCVAAAPRKSDGLKGDATARANREGGQKVSRHERTFMP